MAAGAAVRANRSGRTTCRLRHRAPESVARRDSRRYGQRVVQADRRRARLAGQRRPVRGRRWSQARCASAGRTGQPPRGRRPPPAYAASTSACSGRRAGVRGQQREGPGQTRWCVVVVGRPAAAADLVLESSCALIRSPVVGVDPAGSSRQRRSDRRRPPARSAAAGARSPRRAGCHRRPHLRHRAGARRPRCRCAPARGPRPAPARRDRPTGSAVVDRRSGSKTGASRDRAGARRLAAPRRCPPRRGHVREAGGRAARLSSRCAVVGSAIARCGEAGGRGRERRRHRAAHHRRCGPVRAAGPQADRQRQRRRRARARGWAVVGQAPCGNAALLGVERSGCACGPGRPRRSRAPAQPHRGDGPGRRRLRGGQERPVGSQRERPAGPPGAPRRLATCERRGPSGQVSEMVTVFGSVPDAGSTVCQVSAESDMPPPPLAVAHDDPGGAGVDRPRHGPRADRPGQVGAVRRDGHRALAPAWPRCRSPSPPAPRPSPRCPRSSGPSGRTPRRAWVWPDSTDAITRACASCSA